ncbi:MAG: RNA 2',3'-cyclic phosphodiesterase [Planctomycetes bacterium]|nr:RNA 2',3'-cyclic phosphodiesterase [Planctomycetota bacterium]
MRCFIAIDLDEEIKADLADLQDQIKQTVDLCKRDCTWVRPEAIHLTLKFLGDIPDLRSVDLCRVTEEVTRRHAPFSVEVGHVGHFGGRCAKVLWVGAGQTSEPLSALQSDLAECLDAAGWPQEVRRYSAHLTLCRIRSGKAGFELAKTAKKYENRTLGRMPVASVTVYQSQLCPEGPQHTPLAHYDLG